MSAVWSFDKLSRREESAQSCCAGILLGEPDLAGEAEFGGWHFAVLCEAEVEFAMCFSKTKVV